MSDQLDSVLQKFVQSLPCAFGAVVTKNDGLVYANSVGFRDSKLKNPVDDDTLLAFFSCTKAVTTTALLQLVEGGFINSIDDPVEKYLPEINDVQILTGFDDNDKPILIDAKNKPTIRHLLTHTSGLSYTFFHTLYEKYNSQNLGGDIFKSTWDEFKTPYIFEPGTKWHYGASIDWIGKVIYEVTGQSLGEYCTKNIFDKIGAPSLTFEKSEEQLKNSTELHSREPSGKFSPLNNILQKKPEFHPGGHGLYGTITDYMKFLEIFLHQGMSPSTGNQILTPETINAYSFSNLLPEYVYLENTLQVSQPHLSSYVDCFDSLSKDDQAWTANFHKTTIDLPTGRAANSYNWAGLPNLYYWIDPTNGIAGMFATQLFPFRDEHAVKGFEEFETAVYEAFVKT